MFIFITNRYFLTISLVLNSVSVKYVQFGKHTEAHDPFFSLSANHKDCKWLCDKDSSCNEYSIDSSNGRCFLGRCNTYIDAPSCSTCYSEFCRQRTSARHRVVSNNF